MPVSIALRVVSLSKLTALDDLSGRQPPSLLRDPDLHLPLFRPREERDGLVVHGRPPGAAPR